MHLSQQKKIFLKKFMSKMLFICVFTYHVQILSKSVSKQKSEILKQNKIGLLIHRSGPHKFE